MSDLRVGIISEGKTDVPIIQSVIKTVFSEHSFVFTQIQPAEADILGQSTSESGFGWKGVFHACEKLSEKIELQRLAGTNFDLLIIQVDGDIMYSKYSHANIQTHLNDLPCYDEKDSIEVNCEKVEHIVGNWIQGEVGPNTVICIPFINTDIWVAYMLYPDKRSYFIESISKEDLERGLIGMSSKIRMMQLNTSGKVRKKMKMYEAASNLLNDELWTEMCETFVQAKRFHDHLKHVDLVAKLSS